MKEFWITVYGLSDTEAKQLWLEHKTGTIHCTVFPEKTFIYGTADESRIANIVDSIIKLNKDYGIVYKDSK